ncbi:MAG: hypothetical protein WEE66_11970 [Actinomycetota bacterium]
MLSAFRDALTVVGGTVPPFIVESPHNDPYLGTLDVDVVVDPLEVPDAVYRTIAEQLRGGGYRQDEQHPFRWFRDVEIDRRTVTVEVDFLAPVTERVGRSHRHEPVGGEPLGRRTPGTELLRDSFVEREIAGMMPDGRNNTVIVRFATGAVLIVLKVLAMGDRDKGSDAYTIGYVLQHSAGGPGVVAADVVALGQGEPIHAALDVLRQKFSTIDSYGPQTVALYRGHDLGTPEADRAQALAFALVSSFLGAVKAASGT